MHTNTVFWLYLECQKNIQAMLKFYWNFAVIDYKEKLQETTHNDEVTSKNSKMNWKVMKC